MEIIDSRPTLDSIDLEDIAWTLHVGNATRRSLIRYFRPRVIDAILAFKPLNGLPTPDKIKDMEPIDSLTWRMAETVIDNITGNASEFWEVAHDGQTAAEAFHSYLADDIKVVEEEFLQTKDLNLDLSVAYDMAFEIPIMIAGIDEPDPDGPAA